MIYTVSEIAATAIDSIILVLYPAITFLYKSGNKLRNITVTILFMALFFVSTSVSNYFSILEGVYTVSYLVILFLFCKTALNGNWREQLLTVLLELAGIFIVNMVILVISSVIMKQHYSETLLMRNPARIFLLVISKIFFISLLYIVTAITKKQKFRLHIVQAVVMIVLLVITIVAGTVIEKMILENLISVQYASIIMICLVVISILLFYIIFMFSSRNQSILRQLILETQLKDNQIKLQESLQWSNSVRSLQHDLNNHLITISEYLKENDVPKALSYIEKIGVSSVNNPKYTDTNSPVLNAMIDLKRIVCRTNNIDLKCYIQTDLSDFDDVSFSIVFGNLIDNAIEAEMKEETKEIRLSVDMFGSYLHIIIQNRISKQVLVNGRLPETSKEDKKYHGIGTGSIIDTVKSSNGAIEFYEKDGWFVADVLLPA